MSIVIVMQWHCDCHWHWIYMKFGRSISILKICTTTKIIKSTYPSLFHFQIGSTRWWALTRPRIIIRFQFRGLRLSCRCSCAYRGRLTCGGTVLGDGGAQSSTSTLCSNCNCWCFYGWNWAMFQLETTRESEAPLYGHRFINAFIFEMSREALVRLKSERVFRTKRIHARRVALALF